MKKKAKFKSYSIQNIMMVTFMQKRLKKKYLKNAMEVTCKQKWVNIKSNTVQNTMVTTCMQNKVETKGRCSAACRRK